MQGYTPVLNPAQQALVDSIAEISIDYHTKAPATDELKKPKNLVLQKDGLWEIVTNSVGTFVAQTHTHEFLGLKKELNPLFLLKPPKIPIKIMAQIFRFYQDVCKIDQREAHAYILYDTIKKNFFCLVPPQSTTKGGVISKLTDIQLSTLKPPQFLFVADTHSHNTFSPFFSGTDDGDDVTYRLHIVMGNLDTKPEINIRAGATKKWIPDIKLANICEGTWEEIQETSKTVLYPQKYWEKLTKVDMTGVSRHPGYYWARRDEDWSPIDYYTRNDYIWPGEYGFDRDKNRGIGVSQVMNALQKCWRKPKGGRVKQLTFQLDEGHPFSEMRGTDTSSIRTDEDIADAALDMTISVDMDQKESVAEIMGSAMSLIEGFSTDNLAILVAIMLDLGMNDIIKQGMEMYTNETLKPYWSFIP